MTTLPLYGGPLKRDIIMQAFGLCGQSVTNYELEPEEFEAGLRILTNVMGELADEENINLGFNFPNTGFGNAQEESGIPRGSVRAVVALVARALAPEIGKQLSPQATGLAARAMDNLRATYGSVPSMQLGRQTITGAGNRWFGGARRVFFPVDTQDSFFLSGSGGSTPIIPLPTPIPTPSPTPTPTPAFTAQPSIAPASGPVGTVFTLNDGIGTAPITSRTLLLNGTAITYPGSTYTSTAAGTLSLSNAIGSVLSFTATATITTPTPTPTPGAAMVAMANQTQPGATQRYYQPKADRAGTWAITSGYTIDAATGIFSPTLATAGDGTAQKTSTPTIMFTPADGTGVVTVSPTITFATIAARAVASFTYSAPFTGTAGTTLESLPGWTADAAAAGLTPTLDGSGNLVGRGGGSSTGYDVSYNLGGTAPGTKVTWVIGTPPASSFVIFSAFVNNDQSTKALMWLQPAGDKVNQGNGLYFITGGNANNYNSGSSVNYRSDGTATITAELSADGKSLTLTIAGVAGPGNVAMVTKTFDVTGVTLGTRFGFECPGGGNPSVGAGQIIKSLNVVRSGTNLSVTTSPTYSTTNSATYGLSWGTKRQPSAIEHSVDGGVTWLVGASTINADGTISYVATSPDGGNYTLQFRPRDDTAVVVTAPNATRFLAAVQAFESGYNEPGANYYTPTPLLNNWGKYVEIRTGGQIFPPLAGITTASGQVDTVQTDVGTTITSGDPTLQVVSSNPSTGVHTVRVTGDTGGVRFFSWSGTQPTFFTVTRGGASGKISADAIAGMPGPWMRNLDMTGANVVPVGGTLPRNKVTDKLYQYGGSTGLFQPFEDMIDFVTAKIAADPTFKGLWHVMRVDTTDAEATAEATYARDNLPASASVILEFGNEDFNYAFTGSVRVAVDGIRNGHWGDSTFANPKPAVTVTSVIGKADSTSYKAGNTDSPAANAGDLIMYPFSGYGNPIWQAKTTVPAGAEVNNNSYWTLRSDMDTSSTGNAVTKWRSVRHNQIIDIWRQVWGSRAAAIKPVIMGWQITSLYDSLANDRTYVPGYFAKVWGAGYAFYWDDSGIADYSNTTPASIEAQFRANMPSWKSGVTSMVADCLKMGVVPCCYEGGVNNSAAPNYQTDAYKQNYLTMMQGSLGYNLVKDQAAFMKANVPGVGCYYNDISGTAFGLRARWTDTANKRWTGWRDGLAS